MAAKVYYVESFHINVSSGDAAIHLLLTEPETKGNNPVIHRAVLIDGGDKGKDKLLVDLIETIQTEYDFSDGGHVLRFDSVVITHWDADHYKGVVALIEDNLRKQNTTDAITTNKCEYFKYDSTGKQETVLYAPYWVGEAKAGTAVDGDDDPGTDPPAKKKKLATDRPDGWTEQNGNLSIHLTGKGTCEEVCGLNYRKSTMIGVNFFTNDRLNTGVEFQKVTDITMLISSVPHPYPVGMFCVCTFGWVIGNGSSSIQSVASDTSSGDLDDQLAADDGSPIMPFVIDKPNDPRNRYSIGAIVLWKGSGRVSHYFAGDAMYATEEVVAKWIGKEVTSMKLSHHGSDTSTPIDLVTIFKPRTMVASAGSRHGHPSMCLFLYMLFHRGMRYQGADEAKRLPTTLVGSRLAHFDRFN